MFRRTLPAVALTTLLLIAIAFALNRPADRVVITIERSSVVRAPGSVPPRYDYVVEGSADDGGSIYRHVIGVQLKFVQSGPGQIDTLEFGPIKSKQSVSNRRFLFEIEGFFTIPEGDPFPTATVQVFDWGRRAYEEAIPCQP